MSRDRDREKKRDQEDEEEAYERRKLERKLRDKEAAYQEVGKAGRLHGLCPYKTRNKRNWYVPCFLLTISQYNGSYFIDAEINCWAPIHHVSYDAK